MSSPAFPLRMLSIGFLTVLLAAQSASAGWMDAFRDPEDGRLDLSQYLLDRKGALPVPIVITEPAVGYGAGGALVLFQQSLAERALPRSGRAGHRPPNVFGAAGFGTENGTWGTGGGMLLSLAEDRWRVRGMGGYANANLDFFGFGDTDVPSASYTLSGFGGTGTLLYRVGATPAWIAVNYRLLALDARFDRESSLDDSRTSSGIGPTLEHDTRDNIFTPNRGWLGSLEGILYDPSLGSDSEFQTWRGKVFVYVPLRPFVLGARLDARNASGDVPFYMLPYISIRGIPALRYQGRNASAIEAEARWNLDARWGLTGFYGIGRAWMSADTFGDSDLHSAGGTGFRYLLARQIGVYTGIDFAWGPEFALYLQIGSAWR